MGVEFTNNSAEEKGGSLYIENFFVEIGDDTVFSENFAE